MELPAKQFYIHQRFHNIYYYVYLALEDWIAKNIFREDASRVFLASDEYAFRRRFELTDMSKSYSEIDLTSLRFPFANYWPLNSGWQPDRRTAATTAAMIYDGIFEGTTKVRAIPSILSLPTTFYFDREDDARMAYEILYFRSFNEFYYQQDMPYGDSILQIPISMEIKDIQFNPHFKEEDWLKQQRIFIVKANMELRSFVIQPPTQPKLELDLTSDGYLSDGSFYDDGVERYFLTEQVDLKMEPPCCVKYTGRDIWLSQLTESGTLEESNIVIRRLYTENIDDTTVKLNWILEDSSKENVHQIRLNLDNGLIENAIEPQTSSYLFTGLSPNSTYRGFITFINKQGVPKRVGIYITTNIEEKKEPPKNSLVGFSW